MLKKLALLLLLLSVGVNIALGLYAHLQNLQISRLAFGKELLQNELRRIEQERALLAFESTLKEVELRLPQTRELKFKSFPSYKVVDDREVEAYIEEFLQERYPGDSLENYEKVLIEFGLWKKGESLKQWLVDLLLEQAVAFYDEKEKVMLVREKFKDSGMVEIILAHELTHALQDQYFNLRNLLLNVKSEDEALAHLALVEGDATLSMSLYAVDNMKADFFVDTAIRAFFIEQDKLSAAPFYLARSLLFPYISGLQFVQGLFEKGGWEKVNSAFEMPPSSTEQILHPEKYRVDEPTTLSLPDLSNTLGKDWKLLYENMLGELYVSILLEDVENGKQAAEGWDGDFYRAYISKNGEIILVWVSLWDTVGDCDEFISGLQAHVKNCGYKGGERGIWEKGKEEVAIFKNGKFAMFIKGEDVDRVSEFLRRWLEDEAGALFPQR